MVIDPNDAQIFIEGYKALLTEVHRLMDGAPTDGASRKKFTFMLVVAREAAVAEPALFDTATANLEAAGRPVPEEVLEAIQSLMVRNWVFLRETTRYSVFIEPEGQEAYAVLGLTQRPRDIIGGTGAVLQIGIVRYRGAYVCDGLACNTVWLGPGYRKSYSDILASLKKSGRFYTALR